MAKPPLTDAELDELLADATRQLDAEIRARIDPAAFEAWLTTFYAEGR
ncbi:hypothetical protein ACIBG7_18520 [Nonomuraea sp. NPDC050328]